MESVLESIGNTPLLRLNRCAPPNGAELWLKLENLNPTGSVKDRMAVAMIEGAERDGSISPGDTVVEYTGGSAGPALALICRAKGYRALIVIADCFTEERMQLMRAARRGTGRDHFGRRAAESDAAGRPEHGRPRHRACSATRLLRDRSVQQPVRHPRPPRRTRARDLGTDGRARDRVLPRDGDGRHRDGASEALRPGGVFIQAHEPASSAAVTRGEHGPFLIQGWTGIVMPHWDASKVDNVEPIEDDAAVEMTLRLAREDGVFAGISTGANVVGAHRLAKRLGPEAVIVSLAADTGFKYVSVGPTRRETAHGRKPARRPGAMP